ncbi:glycosyltransferase family 4 protein [Alphaproteobacteria bacterium]|nr:glycosyltransferase family 4 protein [Alphaproteobacteria bacterium]
MKKINPKIKVVFDGTIFVLQEYGGISQYIIQLFKRLPRGAVEPKIISGIVVNKYLSQINQNEFVGMKFHSFPPRTGKIFLLFNFLFTSLKTYFFKPDIIHETYYSPLPTMSFGAKRVITIHDMIHEKYPNYFPKSDRSSLRKFAAVKRADHIICVSQATKVDLKEIWNVPDDRISVVHHGLTHLPKPQENISFDSPFIFFVGRRGGYKNFSEFVKQYAAHEDLSRNYKVIAFGGGPFSQNEMELFTQLGLGQDQICQLGGDNKLLSKLYNCASVFVYPSLYEGFGLPLLEAMSCNCPVVTTRCGSIPEVAGAAAEYCDLDQPDGISVAIWNVLGNAKYSDYLIEQGKKNLEKFSWDRCASQTESIYRSLLQC